jgi:hypothetical protein
MIISKLHKQGNELVLAACDSDLIGKTLTNHLGAEIFINPDFYNGEECNEFELKKLLEECTIANLFGTETIKAAGNNIGRIIDCNGVPHAQVFKIL